MTNSALLADEKHKPAPEDILFSLRSLENLLEDMQELSVGDKDEPRQKKAVKNLLYADESDVYKEGEKEEEEEYPTLGDEDEEKMRETAKKTAAGTRDGSPDAKAANDAVNYQKMASVAKLFATTAGNNMNYPSGRALHSIVIENTGNNTVYNSIVSTAVTQSLNVEIKNYETWGGGGLYVESINGVRNGKGGYFWEFIVNGKIPDASIDKFQLHSGDLIEWRLLKKQNSGCGA